jgi:pimeloyl-ACP methyl ester carboxylesterase
MADTTKGVRPAWVDDELFPFESRFIDIDGHTVHYVDEGSGPTLLLLHGNPTWSFLWRDVIRALRDDFRCIALDYPGFGLSTPRPGYRYLPEEHADVVIGFVDALGLKGATLVAQDWGVPIGLATAQRRPGVFDRLVLANTWAWPVNGVLHPATRRRAVPHSWALGSCQVVWTVADARTATTVAGDRPEWRKPWIAPAGMTTASPACSAAVSSSTAT